MRIYTIDLPWPPTVNKYWTPRRGGGKMLTKGGRAYRNEVWLAVIQREKPRIVTGLVTVLFELYPPDKRRRDIDNLPKGMLDGLTHAGIWEDDSQVDDFRIKRMRKLDGTLIIEKGGRVHVTIQEQS